MKKSICVDIDGVLAQYEQWRGVDHFGDVMPGAKQFLERLRDEYEIVIFTCRCTKGMSGREEPHLLANRVREWLEKNELPYDDIYVGQGKPIASYYIDDRGINCNPQENPMAYEMVLEQVLGE